MQISELLPVSSQSTFLAQLCLDFQRLGLLTTLTMLILLLLYATEFPSLEDVEHFVVHEAARCGIEAVCSRRWRYGLGCLLFELTRPQEQSRTTNADVPILSPASKANWEWQLMQASRSRS